MNFPESAGKQREIPKVGKHNARIVGLIDQGTQPGSVQYPAEKRILSVTFECVDLQTTEGKAMTVFERYTFSKDERAKLRGVVDELLGEGVADEEDFDIAALLDMPCIITISHSTSKNVTYANVKSVAAAPPKYKVGKASEPLVSLFLRPDLFDQDIFNALPEKLKNKIATSPEYAEATAGNHKRKAVAKPAPAKKPLPAKKSVKK